MQRILQKIRSVPLGYGIAGIAVAVLACVSVLGNTTGIVSLLASSAASLGEEEVVMFFTPRSEGSLHVGDVMPIQIRIRSEIPFNALGATVNFPSDILEIVSFDKADSILDLWTEETKIRESAGEMSFSGGTLARGGYTGSGKLLTFSVRALREGTGELGFREAEVYRHDGKGIPAPSDTQNLSLNVVAKIPDTNHAKATSVGTDFNDDGRTSLADLSIFAIQLMSSYNPRFDLDADGAVNLKDISILFTKMRQ